MNSDFPIDQENAMSQEAQERCNEYESCAKRPRGIAGIVHCIMCKLANDRAESQRQLELAAFRRQAAIKSAQARLEKLYRESQPNYYRQQRYGRNG